MEQFEILLKNAGVADRLALIKIRYALEIVKNEGVKLVIFVALFALLDKELEFVVAALMLMPVRVFSGGMHMKTNIGCFFYSLAFFILSIFVLTAIKLPSALMFSILGASVIVMAVISPVASYKRPFRAESRRVALKKRTLIVLGIDCAALILLWSSNVQVFFNIGVWVVTLQAIQLFATWAYRKVKGEKNVQKNQKLEAIANSGVGDKSCSRCSC